MSKLILLLSIIFSMSTAHALDFTITIAQDPGTITMFGGETVPAGWKLANGDVLLRSDFPALFQAIGCSYTCPDADHFKLPDMRGIFPKGAGTNGVMNKSNGLQYSGVLGGYEADQVQGHTHSSRDSYNGGGGSLAMAVVANVNSAFRNIGWIGGMENDGTNGAPRSGSETKPASVSVNYMIKY